MSRFIFRPSFTIDAVRTVGSGLAMGDGVGLGVAASPACPAPDRLREGVGCFCGWANESPTFLNQSPNDPALTGLASPTMPAKTKRRSRKRTEDLTAEVLWRTAFDCSMTARQQPVI